MSKLAIIIPAYKPDYLSQTLKSLAVQTNKDFNVYVGDDASPYDLKRIVDNFVNEITINYYRFEDNLGGISLVKQWERCVEMSSEEWIWLFSDDDIASPTAVASFYKSQEKKKHSHLFKFFTKMINANGEVIRLYFDRTNSEKDNIAAQEYLDNRLGFKRFRSYMVEYIFSRHIYQKLKLIDFPLAWAADDANWINYAIENKGIDIVPDYIFWRFSGINISSDVKNTTVVEKKLQAIELFVKWIYTLDGQIKIDKKLLLGWVISQTSSLMREYDPHSLVSYLEGIYSYLFTKEELYTSVTKFIYKQRVEKLKKLIRP